MKLITKVLLSTFGGATVATGITAGTAFPVLSNQNEVVQNQTVSDSTPIDANTTGGITTPEVLSNPTSPQKLPDTTKPSANNDKVVDKVVTNNQSSNDNGSITSSGNETVASASDEKPTNEQNSFPNQETVIPTVSYSPAQYQQFFETANSKGKTQNGKYKDPRDLNKDPNSPNYFAKYYKPVIPQQLTDNGIIVTPQSFVFQWPTTIIYTYNLHSATVSTTAKAVVSGFYRYPVIISKEAITPEWKPRNLNFLKANLGEKPDRSTFEHFVVNHWNYSFFDDAIKAYRYYYQLDSTKTSRLKIYFNSGNITKDVINNSINKITPVYNSASIDRPFKNVNGVVENDSHLVIFEWKLPGYKDSTTKTPFDIIGQIIIHFNRNTKPTIVKNHEPEKTDIALLPLAHGQVDIVWPNPPNPKGWKRAHWNDEANATKGNLKIRILDALWQHYTTKGAPAPATKSFLLYFHWFAYAMSSQATYDYGIKP